ncbi:MAG: M28 family peptidase [Flavobacteriales bacterium]|nr:M28 family peptidase [Flavobacteriales bacterium]
MKKFFAIICLAGLLLACGSKPTPEPIKLANDTLQNNQSGIIAHEIGNAPFFSADSAFAMIEKQVSFGPRVPNTKGHVACGDFLINRLKKFTPDVIVQSTTVIAYTGEALRIRNIMAQFNKNNTHRIVLFAHWDTRPFADRDKENPKQPLLGADDGASGVAVLLEIARLLHLNSPPLGVDIVLFDGEDYGDAGGKPETYCLGAQYWSRNLPVPGYYAKYGILLDMVGAANARFCQEGWSLKYASSVVEKVWNMAHALGFGNYFIMKQIDPITDDHYFVNTIARIPTIDIINFDPAVNSVGFGDHWHTLKDNISIIDKQTLHAVGTTLMNVIYTESSNF